MQSMLWCQHGGIASLIYGFADNTMMISKLLVYQPEIHDMAVHVDQLHRTDKSMMFERYQNNPYYAREAAFIHKT